VWTRRADDTWTSSVAREGEVARLDAIRAQLDVRELFDAAAEPTEG